MQQRIQIIGWLGRDPEVRYTPKGLAVANFPVSTERKYVDSDNKKVKETVWFSIQVWGKPGESCGRYLRKGHLVMVDGRLVCDPKTGGPKIWKTEDHQARANFEINASSVKFLPPIMTQYGIPVESADDDPYAATDQSDRQS